MTIPVSNEKNTIGITAPMAAVFTNSYFITGTLAAAIAQALHQKNKRSGSFAIAVLGFVTAGAIAPLLLTLSAIAGIAIGTVGFAFVVLRRLVPTKRRNPRVKGVIGAPRSMDPLPQTGHAKTVA